jgi:DNA-binding transcriptional MerR regulator
VQELPRKAFYRLSEVCQYTDTQPYVLRFWESEFPQLSPQAGAGGQPVYRKKDIEVVCRIKELLYEEECTLEDARKKLAKELAGGKQPRPSRAKLHAAPTEAQRPAGTPPTMERQTSAVSTERKKLQPLPLPPEPVDVSSIPRQRYEAAVDEIDHLRLALREAENTQRRADAAVAEARALAEQEQRRFEQAVRHLERLREILASR